MRAKNEILRTILLLIGAAGLTFSGLNWHIGITAWFAPVFLLFYTRNSKWYHFLILFVVLSFCGAVSQTGNNIGGLPIVHLINGISFGLLFTILFLIDKLLYINKSGFISTLTFPVLIALLEFSVSFVIGTWGSLAHTQYEYKPVMQFASLVGIYGIWFLISWFASVLYWVIENKDDIRKLIRGGLIFGSVLFAVLLYGEIRLNYDAPVKRSVSVAAVLSDVDIHAVFEKESDLFKEFMKNKDIEIPDRLFTDSLSIQTMIIRTEEAANKGAEIIVWNEIALILDQESKKELLTEIQSLCIQKDVYVLIAVLEESNDSDEKPFNNISIFISPEGKQLWEYKKSFLQPTAEAPITNSGNYEMPVIQTSYGKVGSVTCADLDIQHYIKQASRKQVDILLVPAYDWEEITPLHSQMACIQAVQFGFSLVRANGKGLSVICNGKGNEISSLNTFNSCKNVLLADLPVHSVKTVYSQTGDIFIYLCLGFLVFILIMRVIKKK